MPDALREALRERLTLRPILAGIALLAAIRLLLDASIAQLATTAAMAAVAGLADVVRDAYDLRQSVAHGWIGVIALVGGLPLLLFDDGPLWLPVAFLTIGAWFVLDAVQTARHEGITEETPTGREVYHDYVARRVEETVAERPRTRRELGEALEADDEAIDAAVERLLARDVVEKAGSEFRVPESDGDGRPQRVRDRGAGFLGRIARPITVEFGGDALQTDDGADDRRGSRDTSDDGATARRRSQETSTGGSGGVATPREGDETVKEGAENAADDRDRERESTGGR